MLCDLSNFVLYVSIYIYAVMDKAMLKQSCLGLVFAFGIINVLRVRDLWSTTKIWGFLADKTVGNTAVSVLAQQYITIALQT